MRILAIDPGRAGGIAWADDGGAAQAIAIPRDEEALWRLVKSLADVDDVSAVIERAANAMAPSYEDGPDGKKKRGFGRGTKANWELSGSYHGLRMALIAAGVTFGEVAPVVWQGEFGLVFKGENKKSYYDKKKANKAKAEQLFRGMNVTHATADALLILEYTRRRMKLFTAEPAF